MANPFIGYGKVIGGERLVGRQSALDEIFERINRNGGSVAVIGSPRIGKTSLASEVMNRSASAGSRLVRSWLDLSTIPGSLELFEAITEAMASGIATQDLQTYNAIEPIVKLTVTDAYEAYRCARRMLRIGAGAGFAFQLFIDEFDWIRKYDDSQIAIQRLRDLIYRNFETGLSVVFIARRSLRAIELSISDVSTLDGVCEQHYVGPLDANGFEQLLDRASGAGWTLSKDDGQLLDHFAGGHPYLAEMILCRAWVSQTVSEGASRCLGEIFDFYEHLRSLLDEDLLFDQLIQIAIGPRISLRPGSVERLLRYGLIRAIKTADEIRYAGWSSHFQQYLERCARDTPIVDLWKDTEITLRSVIVDIYTRELGEKWIELVTVRHASLRPMIDGCIDRMNRERKNFGNEASVTVLDYCYPMDLWALIVAEWKFFSTLLGHNKDYWNQRFAHLAKVRTPTAHNRQFVLPAHEVKLAQAYCEEVLARVRG